jgi:hypothetical protein
VSLFYRGPILWLTPQQTRCCLQLQMTRFVST